MKKILIATVAATLCGCSSTKTTESEVLTLIKTQKYLPMDGRKLTNDFDLYYIGWNDANENIAHHLKARKK